MTAPRILVYDTDGMVEESVRASVEASLPMPEVIGCDSPRGLAGQLTDSRFDVLVAGPALASRSGLERLRIIREELPAMSLILVVTDRDALDMRDVVRTGAIDLVDLPLPDGKLTDVIDRALQLSRRLSGPSDQPVLHEQVSDPNEAKRVITIASASGGSGKTFFATNLAWFLTTHGKRRVCILDLDLQFGEVTASLRLRPRYTITDLIQQCEGDASDMSTYIEEFCEVHESGVHVLAAPKDPTEAGHIRAENIAQVIDAARASFDDIIIDTPPALADTVVTAFNRSDELYVMATLDVPSIRNMQVFLGTLDRLRVSTEGIRLLLNKAEPGGGVEVREVLKLFPQGLDATLSYARQVQRSINAGKPVLDVSPTADISQQLNDCLSRLLTVESRTAFDGQRSRPRQGVRSRWSRRESVA